MGSNPVIDKLDDIAYEYINTYRTIKMNSADVKSSTYKGFVGENNNKAPKIKVRDHVRISKYQNIFCKRLHWKLVWRSFWD